MNKRVGNTEHKLLISFVLAAKTVSVQNRQPGFMHKVTERFVAILTHGSWVQKTPETDDTHKLCECVDRCSEIQLCNGMQDIIEIFEFITLELQCSQTVGKLLLGDQRPWHGQTDRLRVGPGISVRRTPCPRR